MITEYRGWQISEGYVGYYATHPDFDAEMDDGQWVGNGLQVHAMTLDELRAEVDEKIEEMEDANDS
jgi:hypothetical protein